MSGAWFGIDLTPDAAVINNFRRRVIPWSDVAAITQQRRLGTRRVILWTTRGERVGLRAPFVDVTGIGSRTFDADFRTIGEWWLAHRRS